MSGHLSPNEFFRLMLDGAHDFVYLPDSLSRFQAVDLSEEHAFQCERRCPGGHAP